MAYGGYFKYKYSYLLSSRTQPTRSDPPSLRLLGGMVKTPYRKRNVMLHRASEMILVRQEGFAFLVLGNS
jgi:hypothetical protein